MNSPPLSVSRPTSGNGSRSSMRVIASITHRWAPFLSAMFSVHPVNTSVTVKEWTNWPSRVGPQCSTRSASTNPGACSCSSPALRTWIELRSRGPGFVPDRPTNCAPSRVGFSIRSIVAPDTLSNSDLVCSFSRLLSSSPCCSSFGNQTPIVAARYFPLGRPARLQTWIRSLSVSYPYFRLRGLRLTALASPFRTLAAVNARLAFALDQPVVATSWSRSTPLAFLVAFAYSAAYFFVVSRRALIDNP
jgi:hypothetical protein